MIWAFSFLFSSFFVFCFSYHGGKHGFLSGVFFWVFLFFVFLTMEESMMFFWKDFSSFQWAFFILLMFLFFPTYLAIYQKQFGKMLTKQKAYLIVLFFILMAIFFTDNLLLFFMFLEISSIPIIMIIFSGGSSKFKGEAGVFMFLFTGLSGFLLLSLLGHISYYQGGDLSSISSYSYLSLQLLPSPVMSLNLLLLLLTMGTFLVKFPLFFLHMWLPKAHVEAPVFGSMILASILLKLGGFGLHIFGSQLFSSFILQLGCLGVYLALLGGLACYGHKDLKVIIALSSVNHMSFTVLGLASLQSSPVFGSLLLMLGHGVISSLMFFMSSKNYIFSSSRSIFFSKPLMSNFVVLSVWVGLIFINSGFPPFLNFLGEVLIMKTLNQNVFLLSVAFFNFLLVGVYGVLLLSKLSSGKLNHPYVVLSSSTSDWVFLLIIYLHLSSLFFINFSPAFLI